MSDHDQNGDFAMGNKAGSGRPKGARNRITLSMKAMRDGHAEAVWQGAIAAAVNGNVRAIELVLKPYIRMLNRPDFKLRKMETAADALAAQSEILVALSAGKLSMDEAQAFADLVDRSRQAIETHALTERVAALEQKGFDRDQST